MPFVTVSRDKRGYEHISLMHASLRRGKSPKPRLLYWFRTPPDVKVGREPFDDSIKRALEAQNPGLVFDWKLLSTIPEPALDAEYWRERRRVAKAAKQARRAEEEADAAAGTDPRSESQALPDQMPDDGLGTDAGPDPGPAVLGGIPAPTAASEASGAGGPAGRRRRRGGRGRRRGPRPGVAAAGEGLPGTTLEPTEPSKIPEDASKEA